MKPGDKENDMASFKINKTSDSMARLCYLAALEVIRNSSPQKTKKLMTGMGNLWWLSFVDETSDTLLGICIVPGSSFEIAVQGSHVANINPGGQVQGTEIPWNVPDDVMQAFISNVGKLFIDKDEIARLFDGISVGEALKEGLVLEDASMACEKCNSGIQHDHSVN